MVPIQRIAKYCVAPVAGIVLATAVAAQNAGDPIRVFVSVPPHAYFVERIGGDRIAVETLVEGSADPHTYNPAPSKVRALSRAHLYFRTGMPFEETLLRRLRESGSRIQVVDLRDGAGLFADAGGGGAHRIGRAGRHAHHGMEDPHIWLSPVLAVAQASAVRDALIQLDPDHHDYYALRHDGFVADLEALHLRLRADLEPLRGGTIFVYHAAFGYFCREYELTQIAVETGGRGPAPRAMRALISDARAHGVRAILAQPQFNPKSAEIIAEAIGGAVVMIDPLARHYLDNLEDLGDAIRDLKRDVP